MVLSGRFYPCYIAGLDFAGRVAAIKTGLLALLLLMAAGCATSTPVNRQNICALFAEKSDWYPEAKKAANKWNSTIPIMMSIMYQESGFVARAKPARMKILWIIPGPRPSDAYGYPQAKDDTWAWYKNKTGNYGARRHNFADAIDFVAWYNTQSSQLAGIRNTDSYNLYLAYHEGPGGFKRGTYKSKKWLLNTAAKVAARALTFDAQLKTCTAQLEENSGWFF